jgi:hypothetical protein
LFDDVVDGVVARYSAELELLRLPRGSVSSCSFGLLLTNTIGTSLNVLLLCQHLANINILTPPILRRVPFLYVSKAYFMSIRRLSTLTNQIKTYVIALHTQFHS